MIGIRDLKINKEESILNALKRVAERTLTSVVVKPVIRMSNVSE
jgi:hypothetical protein